MPFYRDRGEGRGPRANRCKPQDLPRLHEDEIHERIEAMEANPDVRPSKARKTKLAVMGLSAEVLDRGDPRYAMCVRLANAMRKVRSREMYLMHGFVSTGASAMLSSSALAFAGARYIYELAASADVEDRPRLIKTASSLTDSARQNELAAYELCARESVVRKRNEASQVSAPWLTQAQPEVKRGRGRPRKVLEAASYGSNVFHNPEDRSVTSTESGEPTREGIDGSLQAANFSHGSDLPHNKFLDDVSPMEDNAESE